MADSKTVVQVPTIKQTGTEMKKYATNGIEGATCALGEDLGKAILGDVVGELVGGGVAAAMLKDAEAKRWAIREASKDAMHNLLY